MAERMPDHPDVTRLTLESALCTYKSWHKPNRRYPNVYADMAYLRIRKAESRFGPRFGPLWSIRREALPSWARLESTPRSEEHTSELRSLMRISYAVFCLKKKLQPNAPNTI